MNDKKILNIRQLAMSEGLRTRSSKPDDEIGGLRVLQGANPIRPPRARYIALVRLVAVIAHFGLGPSSVGHTHDHQCSFLKAMLAVNLATTISSAWHALSALREEPSELACS